MTNRYEILLALNAAGKEETNKDLIERLEKALVAEGAQVGTAPGASRVCLPSRQTQGGLLREFRCHGRACLSFQNPHQADA